MVEASLPKTSGEALIKLMINHLSILGTVAHSRKIS